jgi:hypothetical protein
MRIGEDACRHAHPILFAVALHHLPTGSLATKPLHIDSAGSVVVRFLSIPLKHHRAGETLGGHHK